MVVPSLALPIMRSVSSLLRPPLSVKTSSPRGPSKAVLNAWNDLIDEGRAGSLPCGRKLSPLILRVCNPLRPVISSGMTSGTLGLMSSLRWGKDVSSGHNRGCKKASTHRELMRPSPPHSMLRHVQILASLNHPWPSNAVWAAEADES